MAPHLTFFSANDQCDQSSIKSKHNWQQSRKLGTMAINWIKKQDSTTTFDLYFTDHSMSDGVPHRSYSKEVL